jgi:hypothetical protein
MCSTIPISVCGRRATTWEVDTGKPVSSFFGSWLEICGKSETGYFLGYEVIKELEKRLCLKEIALLENVEVYFRPVLERIECGG